jgi:hypothetical protein
VGLWVNDAWPKTVLTELGSEASLILKMLRLSLCVPACVPVSSVTQWCCSSCCHGLRCCQEQQRCH